MTFFTVVGVLSCGFYIGYVAYLIIDIIVDHFRPGL